MSKYTEEEIAKADGTFQPPTEFTLEYLTEQIERIEKFPGNLERVMAQLTPELLEQPYRTGGWQLKQVIHHIADSHMQAFTRFKLTLTEGTPTIKPYSQNDWANTADSEQGDVESSLAIIKGLHQRWIILLRSMHIDDFNKCYMHPEYQRTYSLAHVTGMYAWHGNHHLLQIEMFLENVKG